MAQLNIQGLCRVSNMYDYGSINQVLVDYFIILYSSTFIRMSHLYQEYHVHSIVITNDGGMA